MREVLEERNERTVVERKTERFLGVRSEKEIRKKGVSTEVRRGEPRVEEETQNQNIKLAFSSLRFESCHPRILRVSLAFPGVKDFVFGR